MVETTVEVVNETGLHARPASQLINLAKLYKSRIHLCKGSITANCKSIINLLTASVSKGDTVVIRAEGEDEREALDAIVHMIANLKE